MKYTKGEGIYNVIAIGAGTAGLITTAAISGLGGRAALIEKYKMGGDCLNFGCVPSKALIASARLIQDIRDSEKLGLTPQDPQFEFEQVFKSMRASRAKIEPNDSVERFEELGVDVFQGEARFVSPHELEVNGQRLRAKHFVIAAGSRASVPPIDGMEDIPYFTNETVFDRIEKKPERLIVIGGGPIGSELGQVMNRLGVEVHLVQRSPRILVREDPEVSELMLERFAKEGMIVHAGVETRKVYKENGKIHLELAPAKSDEGDPENTETIIADALLVAAGRIPNVENLNLEAAGVKYNRRGIEVNEFLQSSQPHIWAAGDIAGSFQFTHVADYHARLVVGNIIKSSFPIPLPKNKVDLSVLPWVTFTSPEVARVGLNEMSAKEQNVDYDLYVLQMDDVDRAILEKADEGFVKVLTEKGKDKIIGVTIVAEHAGDLLHEFVLAMKHGIGLGKIAATIHAYPTVAEAARKMGDKFNKTRLTPRAKKLFSWLFRRQLPR